MLHNEARATSKNNLKKFIITQTILQPFSYCPAKRVRGQGKWVLNSVSNMWYVE